MSIESMTSFHISPKARLQCPVNCALGVRGTSRQHHCTYLERLRPLPLHGVDNRPLSKLECHVQDKQVRCVHLPSERVRCLRPPSVPVKAPYLRPKPVVYGVRSLRRHIVHEGAATLCFLVFIHLPSATAVCGCMWLHKAQQPNPNRLSKKISPSSGRSLRAGTCKDVPPMKCPDMHYDRSCYQGPTIRLKRRSG